MADPVTVNRSLAQPTRGSDVGTWDVPLNGNFGLLDTIVGGVASIAMPSGVGVTLNAAQLACGTLNLSGALSGPTGLQFPAVAGWWTVQNLTTGNFTCACQAGANTEIIYIPQGEIIDVQVNVNTVRYRNLGRIGSLLDLTTSTTPAWITSCTIPPYLLCDGSSFSAGTYPYLNQLIGTNVTPDLRGRVRAMLNVGTGRITAGVSGIDGNSLFSAGGSQSVSIGQANLPAAPLSVSVSGTITVISTVGGIPQNGGPVTAQSGPGFTGVQLGSLGQITSTGANSMSGLSSNLGSGTPLASMNPATVFGITLVRAG